MAEYSKFFKSINGDRIYTANQFVEYFKMFFSNGLLGSTDLVVSQSTTPAMTVKVVAGEAIIEGYGYINDADATLTIGANATANPRIDRIVLRLNANDAVRSVALAVKQGTAAASPTAPALTTDFSVSGIYEISLAQIAVAASATSILNANITDERLNNTLCGLSTIKATFDNSKDYAKVSNTYTMTSENDYVIATSGTFTITLPAAAASNYKHYTVKNFGSGVITLKGNGAETMDGVNSITLNQYDAIEVFSDLTEWYIV